MWSRSMVFGWLLARSVHRASEATNRVHPAMHDVIAGAGAAVGQIESGQRREQLRAIAALFRGVVDASRVEGLPPSAQQWLIAELTPRAPSAADGASGHSLRRGFRPDAALVQLLRRHAVVPDPSTEELERAQVEACRATLWRA